MISAKAETDGQDDAEIHFIIANEGLDGDKEGDSEVVKAKVKRKPPKISFEFNENQILKTVKWLNQQLRGSLQKS